MTPSHTTNFIYGVPATEIEITFTQMVLVMNLTTFAWNVHDGRRKIEVSARKPVARAMKLTSRSSTLGRKRLDSSMSPARSPSSATGALPSPSLASWTESSFFFPAMLIGPSVDYATYDSLVTGTIYKTAPPGTGAEQEKAAKRRTPYGRRRVAYLHFVIGLAFLGVYAVYGGRGSYARILGPDWMKWGILTKFGFVQFAGFIARTKYYAVWSLSEVSSHACANFELTRRVLASSRASDSTVTTPVPAGRYGTACAMSTSFQLRQPRASRLSSIAGTAGPT